MREYLNKLFRSKVFIILTLLFVFRTWLIPGVRVANDYPLVSISSLIDLLDIPRTWQDRGSVGLGEYGVFTLWSWPQNFLSGFLSKIGLDFSIQERILFIMPIMLIGVIGLRKLLDKYEFSNSTIIVATFFYLTTTYLLLLIDGGQLSIALSYAIFPLAFDSVIKTVDSGWRQKLSALLILFVFVFLDIRFLFVLFILIATRFIYSIIIGQNKINILKKWVSSGLFLIFGLLLLNLYWIIPFIKNPLPPQTISLLTQNIGQSPTTWKHALFLLQPQWYKNIFGVISPINYIFILIPLFVFFTPFLILLSKLVGRIQFLLRNFSRKKDVIFWTLVALLGIFLAKGSNPPFGSIYNYLSTNIPGFSLFRDSTKFFFLTALSYSVLIGFSVDWLTRIFNWKMLIGKRKIKLSYVLNLLLVTYLLLLVIPVYTGKMTGMFSKPIYENQFNKIENIVKNDNQFGRVFWIPSIAPLGYSDPIHTSVEALRLVNLRPFQIGVVGNYEIFNFLREAPFMGELFKISGIKYLVYPYPDSRRVEMKQDNIDYYYAFLDQLSNLSWIEKKLTDSPVPILKTKETKDHIFLATRVFYVIGSDRIYWDLMKINNFDLSKNALVFAEESPGLANGIDNKSPLLVYEKNSDDLIMSFAGKNNMYFPASELGKEPTDKQKFWKRDGSDLIWWRDFLQTKYGIDNLDFDYGGGWAVGEGDRQLSISTRKFTDGNTLFARVMKSNRSGKIEFWQGDEKIGDISTLSDTPRKVEVKLTGYHQGVASGNKYIPDKISEYDKADVNWYKVGNLSTTSYPLIIKTFGDINVINALAAVTPDSLGDLQNRIATLGSEKRIIYWDDLSQGDKIDLFTGNSSAFLSYKKIDPTKYEVEVNDLKTPEYLIFSETYDQLWELNGQGSKPVYSLVNGFYIDKAGNYTLFFTPQRYVYPGLFVSVVTFLTLVGLLIYPRTRKKL